jgi:hypothetical protein
MKAVCGIALVLVLLSGCEGPGGSSESRYEQVSREIERLKSESEAAALAGDNIKVVVNMLSTGVDERFAIDTLWRYADENIAIVKRPEDFSRSGLRIGVGGENFEAGLEITEIYVPRFYYFGRWYAGIDYEFRQAGRSLKVTARRLPSGQIDMELTPVFSRFLSDGGDLELTELSTRVIAEPGRSLVIGGGGSSEEDVATALLSYGKYGEKKQTLVTVTPYVR